MLLYVTHNLYFYKRNNSFKRVYYTAKKTIRANRIFVRTFFGNNLPEKQSRKWENGVKKELRGTEYEMGYTGS